jgi:transposase InsO family protein
VSRDLDLWAYQCGVTLDFSRPGKPTDNAFIEAFNSRFQAECFSTTGFLSYDCSEGVLSQIKGFSLFAFGPMIGVI